MSDTSAIDAALVARLQNDATLKGLLPDGVYFDQAPPGAQRFALLALADAEDLATFDQGRAIENKLYTIKAVMLSTVAVNMAGAAARIDALLEDQPLAVDGYGYLAVYRDRPIRETDPDDVNPAIRWYHRGGEYRVQMAVAAATP